MRRRLFNTAAAAIAVASLGIGGVASGLRPAHAAPHTIHISWFDWPPAHAMQQLADQYSRQYPSVKVVVDTVPIGQWYSNNFNQFKAHKTNFAAAVMDSQWLGEAVTNRYVRELTPWLKQNLNVRDFYPYLFAAYSQYPQRLAGETGALNLNRGHFYGIPWEADAQGFAYRKDLFNDPANQKAFLARYHYKLAIPQSMGQVVDIADFFTRPAKGLYGIAVHEQTGYDAASEAFMGWAWNFGADIWNAGTGQIDGYVNSPRAVQALTRLAHLTQKDVPPHSDQDFIGEVDAAMTAGKVAMIQSWWGGMSGLLGTQHNALGANVPQIESKLGFFNFPGETYQGLHSQWAPLGGMGLSVSAFASQADQSAVLAFARWFQQPGQQVQWYKLGGGATSKSVLTSAGFAAAEPWNAVQAQSYTFVKDFWNVPEYASMLTVQTNDINAAMNGRMSPAAALNDIAKQQAATLRKSGQYPYYANH